MKNKPVQLVIDGEIWLQVSDFSESTPYDRHFMVKRLKDGREAFVFGDGNKGCRPSDRYGSFEEPYKLQNVDPNEMMKPPEHHNGKKPNSSLSGIYRAVVISNEDPDNRMKIQVKIDAIPEMGVLWAASVVPLKENLRIRPLVGDLVWISFRNGDANQPLWLGKIVEAEPPKYIFI